MSLFWYNIWEERKLRTLEYTNHRAERNECIRGLLEKFFLKSIKMHSVFMKNGFIVFQSILHEDLYTFACAQTNFRSTFSTPIQTTPKHGFWMLQWHLLATKIVDHAICSWCEGIKRSHWVPNQDCTADDPPIRCFEWSKSQLLDEMCESSHCHDGGWFVLSCSFCAILRRLPANKWSTRTFFSASVKLCGIQREQTFFRMYGSGRNA